MGEKEKDDIFNLINMMVARGDYPYFTLAKEHAREVPLVPLESHVQASRMVRVALDHGLMLAPQDCHWNAYKLALGGEAGGVKYVEGLIKSGPSVLAHSWISMQGLHVDPTLQLDFTRTPASIRPGNQGLADQYVVLEELTATELHRRLGVGDNLFACGYNFITPFVPYLWGVFDRRFPRLYSFGIQPIQVVDLIGQALDRLMQLPDRTVGGQGQCGTSM